MNRQQKHDTVASLRQAFEASQLVMVTHYRGLTVAQSAELRSQLREVGANMKVTKNTLARIAVKDTQFADITSLFEGPTALTFANDAVAAAKVTAEFAKKHNALQILGAGFEGKILDTSAVDVLSKLPSLDELRSKIVGILVTPQTRIATVLQAPASQVARVVKAYSEKA